MKYKLISITDLWGEKLNLDHYDILWVDEDSAILKLKGYGNCFTKRYSAADCYTVITEKVSG